MSQIRTWPLVIVTKFHQNQFICLWAIIIWNVDRRRRRRIRIRRRTQEKQYTSVFERLYNKALFYCWTHESRLSPDSSPDSLWLLLDSRTRTLTHWTRTRTRTQVQWTRTRTRTLVQWTRTPTWWTRTRTLALCTRTHCRTHESGLTPTLRKTLSFDML